LTRHLALVGTTASGKSDLALAVARAAGDIEIVSVDSMQVYRGMDIGTAKVSADIRAEIPHHLVDVVDPGQDHTVTQFQAAARAAIADIESRGRRALLVGGTGLYLSAVVDDLTIPGQWPDVRAQVEDDPDTAGLHARLGALDPVSAERIELGNRRRIVRALEVTIGSGRPFSSFGPGLHQGSDQQRFSLAGVWLPRAATAQRIESRVRAMLDAGLVEEVKGLMAAGLSRTASQALGYREVIAHLNGEMSLDETEAEIVRRTRAFSRRQRMWFRRDERIRWFAATGNPVAVLPALLGDWARCRS
jgi:tRNA dimethylallyltransferase